MRVGDRVVVTAMWSSFHTMKGRVVATAPHLMILIDHDVHPIRVGEREVAIISDQLNPTGAE